MDYEDELTKSLNFKINQVVKKLAKFQETNNSKNPTIDHSTITKKKALETTRVIIKTDTTELREQIKTYED
jgi:hypothetical protein